MIIGTQEDRALAPNLLLGIPEAIEINTEGCFFFCFFYPLPAFSSPLQSAPWQPWEESSFDSYHRLLLLRPGATRPLESPLAPRRAVDFSNKLTETFNFQLDGI